MCVPQLLSSVHEMDCLREKNISCAWPFWCSELSGIDQMATVQRESVLDVRGKVQFLESGGKIIDTNDSLSNPDYPL